MKRYVNYIKSLLTKETVTTGLAIFSMFFGAGNVVFPLVIGRYAGDKNFYAIIGFLVTAVGVPFLGLVAMVLFNGDYKSFFGRLGRIPGLFVVAASMALIGPFAAIPRCVALSYSTIKSFLPGTTLFYFSLISCVIIYILAAKKNNVVNVLGRILSPILIISLVVIIAKGFWSGPPATPIFGRRRLFLFEGLIKGYNTMDIFAGFFFSAVVLAGLRQRFTKLKDKNGLESNNSLLPQTIIAGLIGTSLLAVIYTGFSYVSAFYSERLSAVDPDAIISAISFYTLGPLAGLIACVAVSLACLTTAIALTVVFTDFMRTQLFNGRLGYNSSLLITMVIAFCVSNIGFSGIVRIIAPILVVCYPALIVLAIVNIAYKLWNIQSVKIPVFGTFAAVLLHRLLKLWF
jgi:LIVCS family branched-chain amino acid:cation transporter